MENVYNMQFQLNISLSWNLVNSKRNLTYIAYFPKLDLPFKIISVGQAQTDYIKTNITNIYKRFKKIF